MIATLGEDCAAMEAAPVVQDPFFEADDARGLHGLDGDLRIGNWR